MSATLTQEHSTGPELVFERKFDGIRLVVFREGNDVRLLSRNRLPQNCPPVTEALKCLPVQELILDGEITWGNDGAAYHVFDLRLAQLVLIPMGAMSCLRKLCRSINTSKPRSRTMARVFFPRRISG